MSDRLKLIIKIIGLFALTGAIGFFLYLLFFRGGPSITPSETGGDGTSTPAGTLPETTSGRPSSSGGITPTGQSGLPPSEVADGGPTTTLQLTSSRITEPTIIGGNKIAFHDPRDGKFYSIDSNGNIVALSEATFPQAETVVFSDGASKAAIEFPDGSNILYDFSTDQQTTLPSHWQDFAFSPDSDEVVSKSLGNDVNSRALTITSTDGSRTQVIAALGNSESKVTPSWSPNNNIVAFSETGQLQSGLGKREIYLLDTNGEATSAIIVDGGNFSAQWSPSGTAILYSIANPSNDDRSELWYTQATGQKAGTGRRNLSVETWSEKCTFANEALVYCAVPRTGAKSSGLDHRLVTAYDDLYSLNVETGRKTLVAVPVINMQMSNLSLSDDQSILYFTDTAGRLNYLRLK
jgi:hypothetical protein